MTSAIDVVETAYRLDMGAWEWLQAICDQTARAVGHHVGVVAVAYRRYEGRFQFVRSLHRDADDEVLRVFGALAANDENTRPFLLPGFTCEYGRVIQDDDFEPIFDETLRRAGIWDTLGMKILDECGCGVFVGIAMPEMPADPGSVQRAWTQIGAHIASSFRLRRMLRQSEGLLEPAEVIFEPGGAPRHVEPDTEPELPVLQEAVERMQQVRSGGEAGLDLWQALTDGRWSLVDTFDTDGKRFVVAVRNDPRWPDPRRLAAEERQVAIAAANGHANKMIAYQLGVPESTVSTRLSSAMRKLGCRSRVELIRLVRLLTRTQ
jgi:DNA-binding CsgD family transcriptional regulator